MEQRIDVVYVITQLADALHHAGARREGIDLALQARAAVVELIAAAKEATATLGHAYHTVLDGELAFQAHTDYQRLDKALDACYPKTLRPHRGHDAAMNGQAQPTPAAAETE